MIMTPVLFVFLVGARASDDFCFLGYKLSI